MSERLDRLEALAENVLLSVQKQQSLIIELRVNFSELQANVAKMKQRVESHFSEGHGAS